MANGCSDDDNSVVYSECLNNTIEEIMQGTPQNPRATIDAYSYQGGEVYVINRYIPDYFIEVVDENCEVICVNGGIAGLMCDDWEQAQFIRNIWTDPR